MLNSLRTFWESSAKTQYTHIDEIELDYKPRDQIIPEVPEISGEPEMTVFESAFLCGILNKYTPQKILEVGIAGGEVLR